jgi:serine phosphatase RsbU (regulator of sigma subunit)
VYEDKEAVLAPGDSLLMFSDGLVEAHSHTGEMFGFPRLRQMMQPVPGEKQLEGDELLHQLMSELAAFTGPDWEQEDDVTLLTVYRF